MHEVTPEFERCWLAAWQHLEAQAGGAMRSWLRVHLNPPFLEHPSFRLDNQVFFVRIED